MMKHFHKLGAFVLTLSFVLGISSFMVPVVNAAESTGVCKSTADTRVVIDAKDDIECRNKGGEWDGPSTSGILARISNAFFNTGKSVYDGLDCAASPLDCVARNFASMMATMVLQLASLLTMIGGVVLNGAIFYTVVQMSDNYRGLTVIGEAWRVIRDVSNMAFIFVLLYAAIQQIIGVGKNVKELIVRIIVVAVLINFSLFFTQFVIDMSNLFTLTFYDAIVPNAVSNGPTGAGLSNAFMKHLNLQNLYSVDGQTMINFAGIITTGVMGSILLLISAFVFFAAGLMFIIRYVVLILVLILSPIAFIAYVLPSGTDAEKYRKQWMDALLGQAFFAPIYMMLTWVTLKILSGVTSAFGTGGNLSGTGEVALTVAGNTQNAQGLMSVFTNFIVVIAFLIFSLVVAKDWASRTPGGVGKLTSWATGLAGNATLGAAGWAGRRVIGGRADAMANNQDLKDKASAGNLRAKLQLAAARKVAGSSMDFRATGIGGGIAGMAGAGKAGGKDGFTGFKKKKAEDETKYAASLAPGDEVVNIAEQENKKTKEAHEQAKREAEQQVNRSLPKPDYLTSLENRIRVAETASQNPNRTPEARQMAANNLITLKAQYQPMKEAFEARRKAAVENIISGSGIDAKAREAQEKVDKLKGFDDDRAKEVMKQNKFTEGLRAQGKNEQQIKEAEKAEIARLKKENKSAGDIRKEDYANAIEKSFLAKIQGYNTAAAAQIRKGKSKEKKLTEAVKALNEKEDDAPAEAAPEAPPATPQTP